MARDVLRLRAMAPRGPRSATIVVVSLVATTCVAAASELVAPTLSLDPGPLDPAQLDPPEPVDAAAGPPVEDAEGDAFVDATTTDTEPGPRLPDGATLPPRDLIADTGTGCGCDPTGRPELSGHATIVWLANTASAAWLRRRRNKKRAGRP